MTIELIGMLTRRFFAFDSGLRVTSQHQPVMKDRHEILSLLDCWLRPQFVIVELLIACFLLFSGVFFFCGTNLMAYR